MKEGLESFQKYSPKDIEFFNKLADKYGLEQDLERLIVSRNGKRAFILKRKEFDTEKNGVKGEIKIEELIKKTIEKLEQNEE